jgi:hypothetical protein
MAICVLKENLDMGDNSTMTEIMALKELPLSELEKRYEAIFDGKKAPSNNKVYLWRKIAYRLQELEFGSLSENAQKKLNELIQKYDPVNNSLLRPDSENISALKDSSKMPDRRLPIPGSIITKNYKGTKLEVKVLENGFEYNRKIYKTISAVASDITGQHWNGYIFFGYKNNG